jgi:hypothetical protein
MRIVIATLAAMVASLVAGSAARGQDEVYGKETTIAQFRWGSAVVPVHPVLGNGTSDPERWLYRYPPLFAPAVDGEGQLELPPVGLGGGKWTLVLPMNLGTPAANRAAYASVARAYPAEAARIQPDNVSHIRPSVVKVTVPLPKDLGGPVTREFLPGTAATVSVTLPPVGEKDLPRLEAWLRGHAGEIQVEYTFLTRDAKMNGVKVTMQTLATTKLGVELNGLPRRGELVYVHRNDVRALCQTAQGQITVVGVIEDPAKFSEDLATKLLDHWKGREELEFAKWGDERWESTYHANDLKPDEIKKYVNKVFTKVQGKDEYRYNRQEHTSGCGGFSLAGIVSLGGHGASDTNVSIMDMSDYLKQNDLECHVTGDIIVPRKIFVRRVNTADFNSDIQILDAHTYVGDARAATGRVDVQLAVSVADRKAFRAERLAAAGKLLEKRRQLEGQLQAEMDKLTEATKPLGKQLGDVEEAPRQIKEGVASIPPKLHDSQLVTILPEYCRHFKAIGWPAPGIGWDAAPGHLLDTGPTGATRRDAASAAQKVIDDAVTAIKTKSGTLEDAITKAKRRAQQAESARAEVARLQSELEKVSKELLDYLER